MNYTILEYFRRNGKYYVDTQHTNVINNAISQEVSQGFIFHKDDDNKTQEEGSDKEGDPIKSNSDYQKPVAFENSSPYFKDNSVSSDKLVDSLPRISS